MSGGIATGLLGEFVGFDDALAQQYPGLAAALLPGDHRKMTDFWASVHHSWWKTHGCVTPARNPSSYKLPAIVAAERVHLVVTLWVDGERRASEAERRAARARFDEDCRIARARIEFLDLVSSEPPRDASSDEENVEEEDA